MTEPTTDPTTAKIKALTAERRRKRADLRERQRATLLAAIAKAQTSNGEALPSGRGGRRANAGRKPFYAEAGMLVPVLDETTRNRIATAGPGRGAELVRTALAHLVGELAEDENLPVQIAAQIEHLDPSLWPVPEGHDRPAMASMPITAAAALCAQVKVFCGRGKLFKSISQMARVAVAREMDRLKGAR